VIIWIDAQLSPALAPWITATFEVPAVAVRDLQLRDATDHAIFFAAREANAIVLTKDADFALLLERLGPPPAVIWIRFGNTSNAYLKERLIQILPRAVQMIVSGEKMVQIISTFRDAQLILPAPR
jgi:predicted nuclease of predicted toxin-antitoxin system